MNSTNDNTSKRSSACFNRSKNNTRTKRQDSYKKKFSSHQHMIIPIEDHDFIDTQKPSILKFWLQCWRSDPYGSRWQVLNHNLSYSAFKKAKKILSDEGLFLFKRESSIRDNRETVCWLVLNLHGSRRNDYWLGNKSKKEDLQKPSQASQKPSQASSETLEAPHKASISIETQTQQGLQNPSGTSQEHLRNSSKEFQEVLPVESEVGDRQALPASDERVSLSPPSDEKKKPKMNSLDTKTQFNSSLNNQDSVKENLPAAPPTKNISKDIIQEEYVYDPYSDNSTERAKEQNLAIEAEMSTEEYQTTAKESFDRIRAILEGQKKSLAERKAKLTGKTPQDFEE